MIDKINRNLLRVATGHGVVCTFTGGSCLFLYTTRSHTNAIIFTILSMICFGFISSSISTSAASTIPRCSKALSWENVCTNRQRQLFPLNNMQLIIHLPLIKCNLLFIYTLFPFYLLYSPSGLGFYLTNKEKLH